MPPRSKRGGEHDDAMKPIPDQNPPPAGAAEPGATPPASPPDTPTQILPSRPFRPQATATATGFQALPAQPPYPGQPPYPAGPPATAQPPGTAQQLATPWPPVVAAPPSTATRPLNLPPPMAAPRPASFRDEGPATVVLAQRPVQPATPAPPPAPPGRPGVLRWLLPIRLWQLVAWQVAALAVALTLGRPPQVQLAGAVLACLMFGHTSVRIGGYCLCQWEIVLAGYWQRKRLAAVHRAAQPLSALVPDLKLRQHVDRAGNRVGLAIHGDGLTAVVRLETATRPDPGTLLESLRSAFTSTTIPLASAQLVVWTVAVPLQAGRRYPDAAPEPLRVYWLALRYGPGLAPNAMQARGGGETGAMRAAASAAVSLAVRLDDAGYASTVLDRASLSQELMVALGANLGANLGAAPAPAAGIRETWRTWSAAGISQACYLPDRRLDPVVLLDDWAPWAAFSCVSYTLRRTGRGDVRGEVVARLGTTGSRRPAQGSAFGRHAVPATGRHQKYVLRTLPLAIDE